MPIKIFINNKGNLKDMTKEFGLSNSTGMWNVFKAIDIDKDGDIDIIGGNMECLHVNLDFLGMGNKFVANNICYTFTAIRWWNIPSDSLEVYI